VLIFAKYACMNCLNSIVRCVGTCAKMRHCAETSWKCREIATHAYVCVRRARHGNMRASAFLVYARENDMLTCECLFACMCPYNFCAFLCIMEVSTKFRAWVWECAARQHACAYVHGICAWKRHLVMISFICMYVSLYFLRISVQYGGFPRCCACVYDCWRRARRGNMFRVCCTRMHAWIWYVCMKMFVEHACPYNSCIWRCCVTWYARHVCGTWYPRCVNDGTGWWVKFLSLFCVCACFTFVNVTKK
jgi:hypothetical protein